MRVHRKKRRTERVLKGKKYVDTLVDDVVTPVVDYILQPNSVINSTLIKTLKAITPPED